VIVGLLAGALSALLTAAVYASEDAFQRLPIHWMWWPAIGGLIIGIGGFFFPQALGVGYDVIGGLLQGDMPLHVIAGVLLVKSSIWAISLGSGTSGGVLAPLLMIGGALGGVEAHVLPWEGAGFWPLVSMGAILGGTMRSPLTGVIFALELTHDVNVLLPLLLAVTVAHGVTVLALRRSILTEKVSRRGFHLSREYAIDPLEIIFAREVARTGILAFAEDATAANVASALARARRDDESTHPAGRRNGHDQRLYPIVDPSNRLMGVVARTELRKWLDGVDRGKADRIVDVMQAKPVIAYGDEPLRVLAFRMAETGVTRLPVLSRGDGTPIGMVALRDLLTARVKILEAEHRRERVLGGNLRLRVFGGPKSAA
jgi:CBS domain-containing protein